MPRAIALPVALSSVLRRRTLAGDQAIVQVSLPCSNASRAAGVGRVLGQGVVELCGHQTVVGGPRHITENAHRRVPNVIRRESGQRERIGRIVGPGVVDDDARIILGEVVGYRERPGLWVTDDRPTPLGAEAQRLAVFERMIHSSRVPASFDYLERAVVEDVAVLVDLHERGALMVCRLPKHGRQVLAVRVQRAGDERGLGAEGQRRPG